MKDKHLFWILIIASIIFISNLGFLYVDIMEARNFVSAREMVDDGNWIFTTMNGEPRYQKPPLPTWLSAWMAEIFGTNSVWALRFPAALSSILMVVFFYKITEKLSNNRNLSFVATLILSTSFLFIFIGKRATWDIYSYSFALMGVYYVYKSLIDSNKQHYINYLLAGIFFGFSILSKGPTGFYVIIGPFFLAYLIAFGLPNFKQWKAWLLTIFATVTVGLSWYVYIYLNDTETFLNILEIESTARTNREVKSFTRYLSFPVQMGIWAIFSVIALAYPYVKKKAENPKMYQFLFWWTLICFVFLCLVPSKKERYLLPLMLPLSAISGVYVYHLILDQNTQKWEKIISKIVYSIVILIGLAIPFLLFGILNVELTAYSIGLSIISVCISIYLFTQVYKTYNSQNSFLSTVAFMVCTTIFGTPVIDEVFTNNKNFHSIVDSEYLKSSDQKIYGYNAYSPEIWFKTQRIFPEIYLDKPNTIPKENEFLMVSIHDTQLDSLENLNWKFQLIETFDDNEESEGAKNHVDRKKLNLYKVIQ